MASFFRPWGTRATLNDGVAATPFVIFGRARSGTSLVASQLNSHHQIRCYGEAFHPKGVWVWTGRRGPERLRLKREKDPRQFASLLLTARRQEQIVGFKVLNDQARPIQEYIFSRSDIKKIIVYRSNVLSVFASSRIAKATDQWIVRHREPIKQATIAFDPDDFSKFVSVHAAYYKRMETSLRASRSPHICMEYSCLAHSSAHETLLKFLGADPTVKLSSEMVKQNTGPLKDRFTNWDRVVRTLTGTKMEEWLSEN